MIRSSSSSPASFAEQWLSLEKFNVVETDRQRFPTLTRDTKEELRREPAAFLQHLIRNNLPVEHLVRSDFIVANEVTARYYDLQTESGFRFTPVRHDGDQLGGLLSQAAILAGLSDGREANPIKRGAWLARKIIAEPPDDPPPNVPELPEDDGSQLSLREKLARHRDAKGCAKCHAGIDPWGLPLEAYDAGGLFRADETIDAASTLPDGTRVTSANDLKTYLAEQRIDRVAFSFLKHLATYAIGRELTYRETEYLVRESKRLKPNGYRLRDMVHLIVKSDLFLEK